MKCCHKKIKEKRSISQLLWLLKKFRRDYCLINTVPRKVSQLVCNKDWSCSYCHFCPENDFFRSSGLSMSLCFLWFISTKDLVFSYTDTILCYVYTMGQLNFVWRPSKPWIGDYLIIELSDPYPFMNDWKRNIARFESVTI